MFLNFIVHLFFLIDSLSTVENEILNSQTTTQNNSFEEEQNTSTQSFETSAQQAEIIIDMSEKTNEMVAVSLKG